METKIVWLFVFAVFYGAFCLFWGVKSAASSRTANDYFLAGRAVPFRVFVLAATAASFGGWAFIGHPSLIHQGGFPYAFTTLAAIAIPLTGLLFLKRQWILGKRFGFVTPGDMFAYYFRSDGMRLLTVLVALIFTIPFLALMLRASGALLNDVTDGFISLNWGIWCMAALLFVYVALGGLRAAAQVGALQCLLLAAGIVVLGLIALHAVGGWDMFRGNLGHLISSDSVLTPNGNSHFAAVPGVIQAVPDGTSAEGSAWTGAMILTAMLALMGIQSAPIFSMWAFSSKTPAAFAPQQVWASAFAIGLILLVFSAIQGFSGHFLGANLAFAKAHPEKISIEAAARMQADFFRTHHRETIAPLQLGEDEVRAMVKQGLSYLGKKGNVPTIANLASAGNETAKSLMRYQADLGDVPALSDIRDLRGAGSMVVPVLINLVGDAAPWLIGLLSVAALAALQAAGAAYMSTAGAMLSRDVVKRFMLPHASDETQKMLGRAGMAVILLLALMAAAADHAVMPALGSLALAYGLQLWPALIAVCFWPFLTRQGVILGLVAGLLTVTLTEKIGIDAFGITAWGTWPLTIHAAGWGLAVNFAIAIGISALIREHRLDIERKLTVHAVLREHAALPLLRQALLPLAWSLTLGWFFFAAGPGVIIGNWIFGNPANAATWFFGIPSIWAWQILFWALGVLMLWFLAYVMQLSTGLETEIEVLADDINELDPPLRG